MAYQTKTKKGRPYQEYKVRSIKGITPRGFKIHEVKKNKIIFKRKKNEK